MFQVVIADDEPVIIKGIQKLVDWEGLGIAICATCTDGASALNAILARQPDLALLDISMPGKTGIDILRELHETRARTKVIFISGFQDFSYAQDALRYGAVEYLLKPVKKEALLAAIGKCLPEIAPPEPAAEPLLAASAPQLADPSGPFCLALLKLVGLEQKSELDRQLTSFAVFNRVEALVRGQGLGMASAKPDHILLVIQGRTAAQVAALYPQLAEAVGAMPGLRLGMVVGTPDPDMHHVPTEAKACRELFRYFYFFDELPQKVLLLGQPVFPEVDPAQIRAMQKQIADQFIAQNQPALEETLQRYFHLCAALSDGRRDAAVYYLLSCLRVLQDRLTELGIGHAGGQTTDEILNAARETADYPTLTGLLQDAMNSIQGGISVTLQKSTQRDIKQAIDYIDAHYSEPLTLKILAGQIHMNSYYFSSYFKKQTGQNFKDYLNQVRMDHAIQLLINTDMRSYEIADAVGFRDYRYFTDLFSRFYGKTPAAYRRALQAAADAEEET